MTTRLVLAALLALTITTGISAAPRWEERRVVLRDRTPAEFAGMVEAAAREWNAVGHGPRFRYRREGVDGRCQPPKRKRTVVVCGARIGPLDTTEIDARGGAIQRGLIVLDTSGNGVNVEPVVLHALGHALGLPHVPDPASIMYARVTPVEHLTGSDRALLRERYRGQGRVLR